MLLFPRVPHLLGAFSTSVRTIATLSLCSLLWATAAKAQQPLVVTGAAQSSSQNAGLSVQNVISNTGLVADAAVPGGFRYLASATNYTSGYGTPNDESPLIHFDFGLPRTVGSFHVWNGNEPGYTFRGFRDVVLQISNDAQRWQTVELRLRLQQAPGNDSYAGQRIVLPSPVTARFIRFVCNNTWRNFGSVSGAFF
jgi:hypothetical protein